MPNQINDDKLKPCPCTKEIRSFGSGCGIIDVTAFHYSNHTHENCNNSYKVNEVLISISHDFDGEGILLASEVKELTDYLTELAGKVAAWNKRQGENDD